MIKKLSRDMGKKNKKRNQVRLLEIKLYNVWDEKMLDGNYGMLDSKKKKEIVNLKTKP